MNFSKAVKSTNQQQNPKLNFPRNLNLSRPRLGTNKHSVEAIYSLSTNKKDKNETEEQKKLRILSVLNEREHPFCWKPIDIKPLHEPETIIHRIQQKDREVKDERVFKWRNFIFKLIICYELWRAKKLSQAFEEVCELESILYSKSNHGDFLFSQIEEALFHVIRSSKAFLFLEQNKLSEAEQLIDLIVPYDHMKKEMKAGIHGIKAAMFMEYGHKGNVHALQEAKVAVKFDKTCPEWFFFISKCMGRIRRETQCHELVDEQEVRNMNEAVKLDQRNATYKVYLAQVLSEKAFKEYKHSYTDKKSRKSEGYKKLMKKNTAAVHIFKEAAELSPNNSHVLIRCARGLMKLPPCMKDLKFINDCVEKARKLAPDNSMVLHVQAMYHERYDCDEELVLDAYEKATSQDNFGAAMDLVRLHHKLKTGDIIEELEMLANKFEQLDRLQVVYTQAGSYLLFIKKDIVGALKYFLKVISIDPNSYAMRSHKSIFLRMREPVNMFDVMLEELQTRTEWNSFSPEERKVLREFRIRIADHESLPNEKKKRLTVQEILDLSRSTLEQDDLYRRSRASQSIEKQNKKLKKWFGKKKASKKATAEKINVNEKICFKPETGTKPINRTVTKTKRKDSTSSISSVDSDYQRDSTVYGPRDFFLGGSNESLSRGRTERFHSQTARKSSSNVSINSESDRYSSGSSLPRSPSICSSIDYMSDNNENLFDTTIGRLRNLSLSGASSASQSSRSSSRAVREKLKQSYEMLAQRKNDRYQTHGSTQSLNTFQSTDYKKRLGNEDIAKSKSSQSLTGLEMNQKGSYPENFTRYKSRDSSLGSSRSVSFLPDYARK